MTIQIGSNFKPRPGYTLFYDASIPESYGGSGSTLTNLSGNTYYDCTLVNSPTFSRVSSGAGSISLNGSNQYGSFPVVAVNGNFTMTSWVRKNDTTSTGWIFGGGWRATQESRGLAVELGIQGSQVRLTTHAIWDGTPTASNIVAGTIQANRWYNVAVVNSSFNATLYLDGVQIASSGFYNALYYTTGGASTNFLGSRSNPPGEYFGGLIGQFVLWNGTALTQTEILNHYNQTKGRYT